MKKKILSIMAATAMMGAVTVNAQTQDFKMINENRWDFLYDTEVSDAHQEYLQEQNEGQPVMWTTPEVLYFSLSETEVIKQEALREINKSRSIAGLEEVVLSEEKSEIALVKAKDMYFNQYFDEVSPSYGTPEQMVSTFGEESGETKMVIFKGQNITGEFVYDEFNRDVFLDEQVREIGISLYGEKGTDNIYWALITVKN